MADLEIARVRRLFGAQVRRLRKDRSLTQAELAEGIDLSLDMVGRIERGTSSASFDTIVRLATHLDVSVASLFGSSTGKARVGERSKRVESIVSSLGNLEANDLDRVHRIILAATKQ